MKQGVIILCGGKSSRMGTDKAFLKFRGKYLLQHVIDAASTLNIPIILVGEPEKYASFSLPVIPDEAENEGPLRGILSGMKAVDWDQALLLSCDTPFVTSDLLREILKNLGTIDALITVHDSKTHPLIAAYSTGIRDKIQMQLSKKQFRMSGLLEAVNSRILDLSDHPEFGDAQLYVNMNTPEEVKLWE